MPSRMAMCSLQHAHSTHPLTKQLHCNFKRPTNLKSRPTPYYVHQQRLKSKTTTTTAAKDDGDIEVAVFRFTLGIPGFDDALIPRVVGVLGASLLLANHLVSPEPVPEPQTRIEIIGTILAIVGIAAPTLQKRLEELRPGKGRRAAAASVPGGTNVFAMDVQNLPENVQQDLAWSSYALLKNANTCGVFTVNKGQVLMCRGTLGSSIAGGESSEVLQRATNAWASVYKKKNSSGGNTGGGGGFLLQQQEPLVLEDRGAINRIPGLDTCKLIPSGANSIAIIPLQPLIFEDENEKEKEDQLDKSKIKIKSGARGTNSFKNNKLDSVVVLVSERERALSTKEVRWAQGVAAKLYSILE